MLLANCKVISDSNNFPYYYRNVCLIVFRPILYIVVRKHSAFDRDIDRLTKFIVYMLVSFEPDGSYCQWNCVSALFAGRAEVWEYIN